ncbi:MAG TPA: DUF3558 domain-containing protein [Amycolatopsis sp.]|nr:DUF3558 domain-containing protein [Amycolatopsis sp.]
MLSRTVRLTAATLASLSLLTACSGGNAGEPPASTPASSADAPSIDPNLNVPAPLPTDALLNNPCDLLTQAEAAQIGLAYPGAKQTGQFTTCRWDSSGSAGAQNSVFIGAVPQNKGGISDIYQQKSSSAYFEATKVDGYPAAYADKHDGRPSGNCTLWVGATDQLAFSVNPQLGTGRNKDNPCGIAQQVATVVVQHLKAAS